MVDDNIKIEPSTFELTRENAKEFYFACNCSSFFIWHEGGHNCEKFYKLNIPQETLDEWINEWLSVEINNYEQQKYKKYFVKKNLENFNSSLTKENILKLYNIYKNNTSLYDTNIKLKILYYKDEVVTLNKFIYGGFLHLFNRLKNEGKVRKCLEEIEDIVYLNTKEGKQYLKQVKEYCKDNNIDYKFSK